MSTALLAACVLVAGLGVAGAIPHSVDDFVLTWSPFQDGEIGEKLTFWTPVDFNLRQTQNYYVLEDLTALDGRQIVGAQQRLDAFARKYVHHLVLSICFGRPPPWMNFGMVYEQESKAWQGFKARWQEKHCQKTVYNDGNGRTTFPDAGITIGAGGKLAGGFVVSNVHVKNGHIAKSQGWARLEHVGWTLYHVPAATRPGTLWHSSSFTLFKSMLLPPHEMSYHRGVCRVLMTGAGDNWAMMKTLRFHAHGRVHSWHAAIMRDTGSWHPLAYDDTGPGRAFQLGEAEYMIPPPEGDGHLEPRLRVGDMIQWVCAFNNTEDRWVKGGYGESEEMCGIYMNSVCISACSRAFTFHCKTVANEMFTPAPGAPVYALAAPWPQAWAHAKKTSQR